jgi:1,4-alpha-glucan branching enzyme
MGDAALKSGGFTFVLHSHLPFYRQTGRWPHGEEVLHEAMAETYIPLVTALLDLADEGVPYRLTLGITPILAEQLGDSLIAEHFDRYIEHEIALAATDRARFEQAGDGHSAYLAGYFEKYYARAAAMFNQRLERDILGACRRLQDAGYLEILTSAATHGYLPLLSRNSSIYGQIAVGKQHYQRVFGRPPRAVWLPECAYRPAYMTQSPGSTGYVKPGIEAFLANAGIGLFFCETNAVTGGAPGGKAAAGGGGALGYAPIPDRLLVEIPNYIPPTHRSAYLPYLVGAGDVAVLARNERTSEQVWAGQVGYPGDPWYREFHRKDDRSGMQYWRITGHSVALGEKQPYDPYRAQERIQEHARHFTGMVEDLLRDYHADQGAPGIVVSAYDTELFGHWWHEGVDWLKATLRRLAASPVIEMTTASGWVERHPPADRLALPESSWGEAGTHNTWVNPATEWVWRGIHGAEGRMERLVAAQPRATGPLLEVLQQAARELLLLQASDWEFLTTTSQASDYAGQRFMEHLAWFNDLAQTVEISGGGEEIDPMGLARCRAYAMRDNPFPDIDYRVFAARE